MLILDGLAGQNPLTVSFHFQILCRKKVVYIHPFFDQNGRWFPSLIPPLVWMRERVGYFAHLARLKPHGKLECKPVTSFPILVDHHRICCSSVRFIESLIYPHCHPGRSPGVGQDMSEKELGVIPKKMDDYGRLVKPGPAVHFVCHWCTGVIIFLNIIRVSYSVRKLISMGWGKRPAEGIS
jgi:hypothetical protein